MKGATKSLFAHTKVCKSSDVVMLKGKKRALQKELISKISCTKKFRKPLKLTLTPHVLYIITKCAVEKARYSKVLLIDVIPAIGGYGVKIETYFTDLVTKPILDFCAAEGGRAEELLPGVRFTYRGEVKSEAGNSYADVDFAANQEEEEEEEKDED